MVPLGVHIFPEIWIMSSKNSLAFARPRDDATCTAAKSRLRAPGTTPVIRDSVDLQPCSFHAKNSIALSAKGKLRCELRHALTQGSCHRFVTCTQHAHVARVLFGHPTEDTRMLRDHYAGDFLAATAA